MNVNSKIKDFYGRNFFITSDVLIPRPETEQIIDTVLNLAGKPFLPGIRAGKRILPPKPVILDVGTGSGCIAITLSLELPDATVYATDLSKPAIEVAQKNAQNLGAPIHFIISHLLDKVKSNELPKPDLVVANLPYVDESWDWLDKESLSREPSIALYAPDHGLALIKELIDESAALKIPHLVLEADPCQHNEISSYNEEYELVEIRGFILYMRLKSR